MLHVSGGISFSLCGCHGFQYQGRLGEKKSDEMGENT